MKGLIVIIFYIYVQSLMLTHVKVLHTPSTDDDVFELQLCRQHREEGEMLLKDI